MWCLHQSIEMVSDTQKLLTQKCEGVKVSTRGRSYDKENITLFTDLEDGGAAHFAETVREIKKR